MARDMSQAELEMYEKIYGLMGARIRFHCDGTTYEGIVGSIIIEVRKFFLRHTTLGDGDYIGNTSFRFREIASLTVVEPREVVNRYPRNEYLLDIIKNKAGKKYSINELLFDGELSDPSDDEKSTSGDDAEAEFNLELPPHLKNRLPNDIVVIDDVDTNFTEVVKDISKQDVIGVSFDGPQISRFGKLTSLCISTISHVYLFDIETMKSDAFECGLRDILEDSSIKKVIHDCRFPSDCLSHRYATELTNVFDTQVADFVVSIQCYNDKYEYKFISSLDCCLRNHLQVSPEFLYKRVKEKKDYYTKRPIDNDYKHDLVNDALYLILLQKTLAKKLLGPLHKNVDSYLTVLADTDNKVLDLIGDEWSRPDSIPPTILMNGIQTAKFCKPKETPYIELECRFRDPMTGKIIEKERTILSEEISSEDDSSSNSEEKMTKELNKENCSNLIQWKSKHQNPEFNSTSAKDDSVSFEENFDTITMIDMPSSSPMDEVYHKLVNNPNFRNHSQSMIQTKPAEHYKCTFTFRRPFSYNGDSTSNITQESSRTVENASESDDFFAKLSASVNSSTPSSTQTINGKCRKLRFVPA